MFRRFSVFCDVNCLDLEDGDKIFSETSVTIYVLIGIASFSKDINHQQSSCQNLTPVLLNNLWVEN